MLQSTGTTLVLLGSILVLAAATREEVETTHKKGPMGVFGSEKTETHVEHGKEEQRNERMRRDRKKQDTYVELNDFERERLLKFKDEQLLFRKIVESYEKYPLTQADRQCFSKLKPGQSIDIVIDVAPSPSLDKLDRLSSDSPVALFWERVYREPSRAYFNSIRLFIDVVTLDMNPKCAHSVIYDHKERRKFYLRGQSCEDVKMRQGGLFEDDKRGLRTLWPSCNKEVYSELYPIVKNNLGYMTKLALWNRDNGLPTVLSPNRRSKPFYTIVISDGYSGAKINELTDDLSRTTVIDVGNRRFVDKLSWDEFRQIAGTLVLTAPQQLAVMADTVCHLACRFLENIPTGEKVSENVEM